MIPLKTYSLVMAEFARLPELPDIGTVIIDHKTGQPFKYHTYRTRWREIAREAGIPDEVWNRDSRAGGCRIPEQDLNRCLFDHSNAVQTGSNAGLPKRLRRRAFRWSSPRKLVVSKSTLSP
jgi:hypothetical protein